MNRTVVKTVFFFAEAQRVSNEIPTAQSERNDPALKRLKLSQLRSFFFS